MDAFSPKNQDLSGDVVAAILKRSGIVASDTHGARPVFTRQDGSQGTVGLQAKLIEDNPIPAHASLVTQVSRWDPLKDHAGVMTGFAHHVAPDLDAHLVLAGPDPDGIADDPGGRETFESLRDDWRQLPAWIRKRVHITSLPMNDLEQNAAVVNALQRHSAVIVQKSLAEGFGLTITEAKPTIGSKVGGIRDQIIHGRSGLLIDEPSDSHALGQAITAVLQDPVAAAALGYAARQRVIDEYLVPCYTTRYLQLVKTFA